MPYYLDPKSGLAFDRGTEAPGEKIKFSFIKVTPLEATPFYKPPQSWYGREDSSRGRLFQHVQLLDLRNALSNQLHNSIVLLGFACDEGVRRNEGRVGAAQGPESLRKALSNIPFSKALPFWDAGTILCPDGDLEQAQELLGKTVASLRERGAFVIVLGGGHEVAWGNFQGLVREEGVDVLNFDAHLDLRPLLADGKGSSGTSFHQMQLYCEEKKIPWRYGCFGLQHFGNTQELLEKATALGVTQCFAETMIYDPDHAHQLLAMWLEKAQRIHLTLCLDVLAVSAAPGVSASQPLGLPPQTLFSFFRQALKSGKVIGFDIAELNPLYDRDEQTAKLAAHFIAEVITILAARGLS